MQIEMRGIDKSFGGNAVLKGAGFLLDDGEVHALMGENGAGKSTLMKILTGVYTKDAGQVIVDGKEVCYNNPQEAEKAGIVFIHQELNVLFDLTVEENMFLGKEIKKAFGICDRKAMRKRVQEILDMLGVDIDPAQRMDELSIGQQQMIEIAKALMVDAKVIIMDEPTAALTQSETEVLFEVVNSLRKKGVSIVYISHRMEEIFELCDRITILRDGTYIDTKRIADIDMNDIYGKLYNNALTADKDCGGLVAFNLFSGEPVIGLNEGRPMFARKPDARMNLANFMRTHLYASLATLKIGCDILFKEEKVKVDTLYGHGGLFKTKGVGQSILAAAMDAPVAVMETAGEGGPWGMAVLAAYMVNKAEGEPLETYLTDRVFNGEKGIVMQPDPDDVKGFDEYINTYKAAIESERAMVKALPL